MKRLATAALCALLVACSAKTPTPIDSSTPPDGGSPSPSASKSPAPRHVQSARAVVWAGSNGLWTYDVKTNTARQIAKGTAIHSPSWVGSRQIAFVQDSGQQGTLRLFDTKTGQVRDLFTVDTGIAVYAVSPDQQTVAYITVDADGYPHLNYRFLVGSQATQTVATLARVFGRDIQPSDQERLAFSRDGADLLSVYTPADGDPGTSAADDASQLQIRRLDGSLLYGVDMSSDPTMGFWSPDGKKVFYRTNSGARAWTRSNGQSAPVSSLKWFDPSPSPDGKLVAYDDGTFDKKVRVATVDLKTGTKTFITNGGFAWPVFANTTTVWVQRATPCAPNCPTPVSPGPEVFAVNLKTGAQTKLALPTLQDVGVYYS